MVKASLEIQTKYGFPYQLIKKQWHFLLDLIMRYVTYDGCLCRYTSIMLIYYCFFNGQGINMPFYLINTLQKMAYLFQNNGQVIHSGKAYNDMPY